MENSGFAKTPNPAVFRIHARNGSDGDFTPLPVQVSFLRKNEFVHERSSQRRRLPFHAQGQKTPGLASGCGPASTCSAGGVGSGPFGRTAYQLSHPPTHSGNDEQ
jgi:hypothetical protein